MGICLDTGEFAQDKTAMSSVCLYIESKWAAIEEENNEVLKSLKSHVFPDLHIVFVIGKLAVKCTVGSAIYWTVK